MSVALSGPGVVNRTLAQNRLGVPAVVFFVLSAAAPLTVNAGVIPTGFAVTGITGIPAAFLLVGAVLAVFTVGYVTMARHVANAGAFYTYIAHGLGRAVGVGAANVAVVAYYGLQIGLYGAAGVSFQPLLQEWFGWTAAWWVIAFVAWALTAVLGLLRVDINGLVLAVLLVAEIAIIVIYSVASLLHPAGGAVSTETLNPANLFQPGLGALLAIAVLGFVGFESSVVFSEESKDPRRTVKVATSISVVIIAGLYAFSSWAMTVQVGADRIVDQSRELGPEVLFGLAATNLGQGAANAGHALFATSVLAAMISFHNTSARYTFSLGREGVLPAWLGRTSRSGSPIAGSLLQSGVALVVIVVYAIAGWDPLTTLFFWWGTSGGLGILALLALTAVAIVVFFIRNQAVDNGRHSTGGATVRRLIAPMLAAAALLWIAYLAYTNIDVLLGVRPDSLLTTAVPVAYLVAAMVGIAWALFLRRHREDVYLRIGMGAKAAIAGGTR